MLTNPALFDAPPFLQRDALVLVTGLFMYPAGALFLFLSPSWGCVSTLSGLRFILFAFLLSGLTSPLLPPSDRASSESPPGSQDMGFEPVPFRVCANQSDVS